MRFNLGDVWKSTSGIRAAVVEHDDDGRRGKLFFENGDEQSFQWMELTQAGKWHPDPSPRPTKTAAELRELVLGKIAPHHVCPEGWDVVIVATSDGRWRVNHKAPHAVIAYPDCADYVGGIVRRFGLLFDLA
jgi:hypothetical protein